MKRALIVLSASILFVACKNQKTPPLETESDLGQKEAFLESKADAIINSAIEAHGGDLYDKANYAFVFRNKEYRFANNKGEYTYSVKNKNTFDVTENGNFKRAINGNQIALSEKDSNKYKNSLNSVIYFATLPHKLKDNSVNKKYIEEIVIKGLHYDAIEITFNEEGGGEDHEDVFYYWVNQSTKKIDYLAYSYKVNKGGVRFRSANKLEELSRIKTENVINLNHK